MYSPRFQITNKTLLYLIEVEVASKIVQMVPLQPEWETRLKTEALAKNTWSLVRFTGNQLSLEDVVKIVRDEPGRDDKAAEVAMRAGVVGKERDVQQVLNMINTFRLAEQIAYLSSKFGGGDFGEIELKKMNTLLGERLLHSENLGVYREKNNPESLLNTISPQSVEVPFQMEDLFAWFKSVGRAEIHPLIKTGIIFYELLRIDPFWENNLLATLSFVQLILLAQGYDFRQFWIVEEELLKNKENFVLSLNSVERNSGEMTVWLEFLTKCLSEASEKTKIKVLNLAGDAPIFKSETGRTISLSERQIAVMEQMTLRNEMTIKEIRTVLPLVSDDTILRDLKDLIDKKLIRKKGKTKGAIYVMGKVKNYR